MKPLADGFIKLIKLIIAPIIFIGNGLAAIVISRWEGELDRSQLKHALHEESISLYKKAA